ncbi:hypothetical protein F5B22DRAFT_257813 [Xylaria bambusicola]|uniref:uncharacterized protein n=1 Tax=Xylaria bambusicola TaxID=326684 RepID=UPI002007BA91|nr:uncharacterized protein F5B22DRAFT_257813 [Xylaria bambusicola]KAI0525877.1 hypothetical protein F5B22DRAFT_257813 [Xylaria bambusicola]
MVLPISFPQASLATAIGLSAAGIWVGTTPPNPSPDKVPSTGDSIRWAVTAQKKYGNILYLSLGAQALHHMSLVLTYPEIPRPLLRYGVINGLDPNFVTWSRDTAVPIALVLAGASLRVLAYSGLGTNFTYGLAEPDQLKTTGLYRYIQHPSYTASLLMAIGALRLWWWPDGILSCVTPPKIFPVLQGLQPAFLGVALASIMTALWKRVKDEEAMLQREFGKKWEAWHSCTARFIPFIF